MAQAKGIVLTSMLAASIFLAGCAGNGALSAEKVATVDGTVITQQDYDAIYQQFGKMFKINENPESSNNPMIQETLKRMTLNKIIFKTLMQNDALKQGISVTEKDIQSFKDEQTKGAGGKEALAKLLQENHLSEAELDGNIREQVLMTKFIEKRAGDKLQVSEQDIKNYYETHPTEFSIPETIYASHILVKAIEPEMKKALQEKDPKISEVEIQKNIQLQKSALKAKAEAILVEVKNNPAKFGEIAKRDSEDVVSAKQNGYLDGLVEQTTDPVFWKAIKTSKPGSLYPSVLATQFGYHIIAVKDHVGAHKKSFAEAKEAILNQLVSERKQKILETWVSEKKSQAKIVIEPKYQPQESPAPGAPAPAGAMAPPPGAPVPERH